MSDTRSPTPPPLEDLKSTMPSGSSCHPNPFWLDSMTPDSTVMKNANESLVDELGLCANLSQMYISNQQDNPYCLIDASMGMNRLPFRECSLSGNSPINVHKHGDYHNFKRGFLDSVGFQSPLPRSPINHGVEMNSALSGITQDYRMANLFGSRQCANRPETILPQLNGFSGPMDSPRHRRQLINDYYDRGSQAPDPTAFFRSPVVDVYAYME